MGKGLPADYITHSSKSPDTTSFGQHLAVSLSARCGQYRFAVASGEPPCHSQLMCVEAHPMLPRESVLTGTGTPIIGCGSAALWARRNLWMIILSR